MASKDDKQETKPLTQIDMQAKPKIIPKYNVVRDVLTHEVVIKDTGYATRDKSIPYALRRWWATWSFVTLFTGSIPIVQWLPKYSIRNDLLGDIIAGFTVAIMNIPHGMAYGLLAGVGPGNGLYMAIYPVLVYMVLGTSRHISIGTFAVISMMTLKVVQTHATVEHNATAGVDDITPLQVVTSLALTVGMLHLAMGFLRLGTLSSLLSDPLVNGFTTGAACHVVTSQLKDVLGVTVERYKGAFKIVKTLIDLGKAVPNTNLAAFVFCCVIMVFMTLSNECIKPQLRKYCRVPLPAELIAVIGGTLVSLYCKVNEVYGINLVGTIPTGLPPPVLPRLDLIPTVAVDAVAIAIVSYSIVMSMGFTFAKKFNYEVRPNQELFAMGIGNTVGGFFNCIPMACSLSRSVIQVQTGGVTQLTSLVSAILIIITILWIGPFFSALPRCVLAGVIIVALKPMFMQAKELKKFSKQGKLELLTWIFTFLVVVLIDIDYGLLVGIVFSLITLYIKGLKTYSSVLGYVVEAPAVYVDLQHHRNALEVPRMKIFRYYGSLNFATKLFFRHALYDMLMLDAKAQNSKQVPKRVELNSKTNQAVVVMNAGEALINGKGNQTLAEPMNCLVVDFSMLGHIDVAGCYTLGEIQKDMATRGVRLLIAAPSDRVYDTLVHSMALGEGPFEIFPTLHDAVVYGKAF